MDGSHQLNTFHTLVERDAPASLDARRVLPVSATVGDLTNPPTDPRTDPLTGPLREGENLGALLTAYRAERDSTVGLWSEAMGHLREYRYDKAVLCALELARRARDDSWEPLPDGFGLAPLREWLALWEAEARRILGAVVCEARPAPDEHSEFDALRAIIRERAGLPPLTPSHTPAHPPAHTPPPTPPPTPLDPSRLARRLSRWKGEEEEGGHTQEERGKA